LLIGGGFSNITREILKHPVKKLTYLEIDQKILEKLDGIFQLPTDNRFKIIIDDARYWLRKNDYKFDVIIMQIPAPYTLLINRYYTEEFFSQVERHLNKDGLFSFALPSQPNYLSTEHRMFFMSIKKTLLQVFPEVVITPGETAFFIASNTSISPNWSEKALQMQNSGIETKYFRDYYLFSEFSAMRFNDLSSQLETATYAPVNYDFNPISSFYNTILWSTHFKINLSGILKKLRPSYILVLFTLISIFLMHPIYTGKKSNSYCLLSTIAITGFAEISFQILTILIFQIFYGSVFWKMGIIFSSFMAGLICGSYIITKKLEQKKNYIRLALTNSGSYSNIPAPIVNCIDCFQRS
jgi:spermidine synthase